MNKSFFIVAEYLRYIIFSRHRKGHGIHSPFVFQLLTKVIESKTPENIVQKVEAIRKKLKKDKRIVFVNDMGAPSRYFKKRQRPIKQITTHNATSPKFGQLLWRLVHHFQSENMLELGTSLGLSAIYIGNQEHQCRLITMEGSSALADIARDNLKNYEKNIEILNGEISEMLPNALKKMSQLDFVYFDANHQYTPTMEYFRQCLPYFHKNSVLVVADIHLNKEMKKAWDEICCSPDVVVSIDLFYLGLLFFNKQCSKQNFVIRF